MDIFQVILLCIFGGSSIWFIGRWYIYEVNLWYWNFPESYRPREGKRPTFWDK
jgi:hypothetical protein